MTVRNIILIMLLCCRNTISAQSSSVSEQDSTAVADSIIPKKTDKFMFPEEVLPLIETKWSQEAPYNILCPIDTRDTLGGHLLAGCGPLVMSQTIRYFRYPSYSSLINEAMKTPNARYDYDKMYIEPTDSTTFDENLMVARLVRDCGTAGGTVYGQSASATKLNSVVTALKQYFGYSSYMNINDRLYYHGTSGAKAWKETIYEELKAGRPVIIRAEKSWNNAHVFIIDGCRDSMVHVNWGWGGKRNGYYDPDSLDGYRFNQRMITSVAPKSYTPVIRSITVRRPGELEQWLTAADWLSTYHLKVSGNINKADIAILRQLCGGGNQGERNGNVSTLDLSGAVILAMPDKAFYACVNLTYIKLPMTLPAIPNYAFAKCQKLNEVKIYNVVSTIGNGAFSGCFNLISAELPTSLTTIGPNAYNSCNNLLSVTVPKGVTTIGTGAFAHCSLLTTLKIPRAVKKIGNDVIIGTKVKKISKY